VTINTTATQYSGTPALATNTSTPQDYTFYVQYYATSTTVAAGGTIQGGGLCQRFW